MSTGAVSSVQSRADRFTASGCPHDVNALLNAERQYIPTPASRKAGMVWCETCSGWVPFEWEAASVPA